MKIKIYLSVHLLMVGAKISADHHTHPAQFGIEGDGETG